MTRQDDSWLRSPLPQQSPAGAGARKQSGYLTGAWGTRRYPQRTKDNLVAYFAGHAAANAINQFGIFAAIGLGVTLVAGLLWLRARERRIEG